MASHSAETLLRTARLAASRQAWGEVRTAIRDVPDATQQVPELAVLLAEAQYRTNHLAEAEDVARAVEQIPGGSVSASLRSRAANVVGAAAFTQGRLGDAIEAFERAMERGRLAGDDLVVARAMNNLGNVLGLRGDSEASLSHYRRAIPLYEHVGVVRGLAECYHNMAIVARDLGQWQEADEIERRSAEFARSAGDDRLRAMAQVGRAETLLWKGDAAAAAALASRAADTLNAADDASMEADARCLIGRAQTALGQLDAANESLMRAAQLSTAVGDALVSAEVLEARARLAWAREDVATARELAASAHQAYRALGTPQAIRRAETLLATFDPGS
jgi:tetratricopeptide (TPR) repeat protein